MTAAGTERHLDWDGCFNVRDLGGLGGVKPGAVVRADRMESLTARGWAAVHAYGIRTVIDLRNDDERGDDTAPRPAGITTVRLPLDGIEHRDFWDEWWGTPDFGTPLYFRPFMERFPDRVAAVVTAVARAAPGGVAYHCSAGRDRTGLISLVLLRLMGVAAPDVAADHGLSAPRMKAMYAARGMEDDQPAIEAYVAGRDTTVYDLALEAAAWLGAEAYLRAAGVAMADLAGVRARMGVGWWG
ncbi:tyrosine-protein phosphatase [Streptomyces sp. SYSU K217416]